MTPPNVTGMRFRDPTMVQTVAKQYSHYQNGTQKQSYYAGEVATSRHTKSMYDVVTPNFRKRSAEGEIINSPMYRTEEKFDYPLIDYKYSDKYGNELYAAVQLPVVPTRLDSSESIFTNNYNNAITDAYANISANEGNTLLWIGEAKETVSMCFDIGKGLRALYEKTKKQRKEWAKGKLTIEAQQQLTLQILYGLLPLEQQIADFMEGLFRIKQADSRQTARGLRVQQKNASYTFTNPDYYPDPMVGVGYMAIVEESFDVVVRAGVLYEIDISDTPWISVILDPKSVVSTAYALARLSFVWDWFINVGGTLAAWSPSMGVNELSAWVTVEERHIQTVKYVPPITLKPFRAYPTGGGYTRILTKKWRKPINRSDLAIIPRLDVNLDVEKLLAMVLLFAKIKKTM